MVFYTSIYIYTDIYILLDSLIRITTEDDKKEVKLEIILITL